MSLLKKIVKLPHRNPVASSDYELDEHVITIGGFTIRYAYKELNHAAIYKVRLDDALLIANGDSITSNPFTLSGSTWCFKIANNGRGLLVCSANPSDGFDGRYHLTTTLVNHKHKAHSESKGISTRPSDTTEIVVSKYYASTIRDKSREYLQNHKFALVYAIRLQSPDIERQSLFTNGNVAYFAWSFKDLDKACPYRAATDHFQIGGKQWRFEVLPRGSDYNGKVTISCCASDVIEGAWTFSSSILNSVKADGHKVESDVLLRRSTCELVFEDPKRKITFDQPNSQFLDDGWFQIGVHLKGLLPDQTETTRINEVNLRFLRVYARSSETYSTATVKISDCAFDRAYKLTAALSLSNLTKLSGSEDRINELGDYWLAKQVDEDTVELVQRASYVERICPCFRDLCGNSEQPMIFVLIRPFVPGTSKNYFGYPSVGEIRRPPGNIDTSSDVCSNYSSQRLLSPGVCSRCEIAPVTYGLRHSDGVHNCVCENCALTIQGSNLPCPGCGKSIKGVMKVSRN